MPNFRRYYVPNAIVFVTAVTHNRIPHLGAEDALALFWQTLRLVQEIHPFNLLAHVTLPEHFHWFRNERDLARHFDYIHSNPVKHGYVKRPEDWEQSTYAHWLERGYYEAGWRHGDEPESMVGLEYE